MEILEKEKKVTTQSAEPGRRKSGQWRTHMYTAAHRTLISRQGVPPTEQERNMVLTGFVLSIMSIVTAFFPICAIPMACAGLVMGVIGRRIQGVRKVATWCVVLSIIGGTLGIMNIVITVGFYYINRLLWG
jgi:hypothetical protein